MTLNVHLSRPHGTLVGRTGPLWAHSVFEFESNMGTITIYSKHGPNVFERITEKYLIAKNKSKYWHQYTRFHSIFYCNFLLQIVRKSILFQNKMPFFSFEYIWTEYGIMRCLLWESCYVRCKLNFNFFECISLTEKNHIQWGTTEINVYNLVTGENRIDYHLFSEQTHMFTKKSIQNRNALHHQLDLTDYFFCWLMKNNIRVIPLNRS